MKELTQKNAKQFAYNKFKELDDLSYRWNIIHSQSIIKILKILTLNKNIDEKKLFTLAWIHDIGKIISYENHAKESLNIISKEFKIDNIDIDCILNHGSSSNPVTSAGKMFRYADGLSLFTAEAINFRYSAEKQEGVSIENIGKKLIDMYEKYKIKYSDSHDVLILLDKLFQDNLSFHQ